MKPITSPKMLYSGTANALIVLPTLSGVVKQPVASTQKGGRLQSIATLKTFCYSITR